MRHCWLTRMLYCPARLPLNFSNRLAGGTLKSSNLSTASRISSFSLTLRWISVGKTRDASRLKSFSVSLLAKVLIIFLIITQSSNNVKRYGCFVTRPVHQVKKVTRPESNFSRYRNCLISSGIVQSQQFPRPRVPEGGGILFNRILTQVHRTAGIVSVIGHEAIICPVHEG